MNIKIGGLIFAVCLCLTQFATAELVSVEVGGSLKLRGNAYTSGFNLAPVSPTRWPAFLVNGRPIGSRAISSIFDFDKDSDGLAFFNQRTRLHVRASFTDEVSAFIEVDSFQRWGDNSFRSDYATGIDRAGDATVDLYQAYIEAKDMWGTPLSVKIGRQEIELGNSWLVGANRDGQKFSGLSFDGVRVSFETDLFSIDGFATTIESRRGRPHEDVNFYGIYASYTGLEEHEFDAYWLYLRDGLRARDTSGLVSNFAERLLSLDDYGAVKLHTVGLRAAGRFSPMDRVGGFSYSAEVAYQFGDPGRIGQRFRPTSLYGDFFPDGSLFGRGRYGDNNASFDAFAADLTLSYTLDQFSMFPTFTLRASYLGGEDNRDISFTEWLSSLINPFHRPRASTSFNRLFSELEYSRFFELDASLSNVWIVTGAVQIYPTESTELLLALTRFESLNAFHAPRSVNVFGTEITPLAPLSFITRPNSTKLGWELSLRGGYDYSDSLSFEVGWAHLFVGDGLAQGNFNDQNGFGFNGGFGSKDVDYFWVEAELKF